MATPLVTASMTSRLTVDNGKRKTMFASPVATHKISKLDNSTSDHLALYLTPQASKQGVSDSASDFVSADVTPNTGTRLPSKIGRLSTSSTPSLQSPVISNMGADPSTSVHTNSSALLSMRASIAARSKEALLRHQVCIIIAIKLNFIIIIFIITFIKERMEKRREQRALEGK
jgi:hypothetical protein